MAEPTYTDKDTRPPDTNLRTKNQKIEEWLGAAYDFRYNLIKQKPEWKEKTEVQYRAIDKYKLLSIKRELDAVAMTISKDNLMDILCSSFSPAVNPVKEYFNKLPKWDGGDHIKQLCQTVRAKNGERWYDYMRKWLVGVVANVFIDEYCANHVMLVLTGDQGKFKTTWLENLCPKSLKQYLFTGKLNLESKDTLTLISENLFVNIDDQLKQLHKRDENELKNLITINHVKYRRPYDPIITEYPHLCSFMGSVNGNEFLNDPTGSRRFLPFEVLSIDIKTAQALNMDMIWAQAVHLFKAKERYWFNDEEILQLHDNNSAFSMISQEEELLNYYFSPQPPSGSYGTIKFLPTAVILSILNIKSRMPLSMKKLGEALAKSGFIKKHKMYQGKQYWGYDVYEKTVDQIEQQTMESSPEQMNVF